MKPNKRCRSFFKGLIKTNDQESLYWMNSMKYTIQKCCLICLRKMFKSYFCWTLERKFNQVKIEGISKFCNLLLLSVCESIEIIL